MDLYELYIYIFIFLGDICHFFVIPDKKWLNIFGSPLQADP